MTAAPPRLRTLLACCWGDLPNFRLVQADTVRAALGAYAQGLDFADALHLGLSSGADALLTFDKVFAKRARGASSLVPVQVV